MKDLFSTTVVVVGGNGLIGQAIVSELLDGNANVVIADLKVDPKYSTLQSKKIMAVEMDITDENSVLSAIEKVVETFGAIQAVVNVAYPRNRNYGAKLELVSFESFCENVDLHLGGYFLVSKIFASYFSKIGGGHVVNFSSIYGLVTPRFEIYEGTDMTTPVEYSAIKAGIISMSRYFAKYYLNSGVRFNCVAPGGVIDQQPRSFVKAYERHAGSIGMIEPADIAGVVLNLLRQESKAINGQTIVVDDGWTL